MDDELENKTNLTTQEFARLTGQPCYYLPGKDINNIPIDLTEGACPLFCYEIAKSSVGNYLCRKKRQALVTSAVERKEPAVAICHAGLYEIMVPAFSGAELAGVFNTCFAPFHLAENIKVQIDLYQKKYDSSEAVLLKAVGQIAPSDENAIHSVKNLLNALVTIFIRPEPPSTEGGISLAVSQDWIDGGEEIITHPVLSKALSFHIEQMKDAPGAYQASDDLLQKLLSRIFVDIRTGKLVKAKESFKAVMNVAYTEEGWERERYAAYFVIFRLNDYFLRKLSYYKEVYDLMVPIVAKLTRAGNTEGIREIATEYFDGLTQIYQIRDENRNAIIDRIVNYVNRNYERPFTIQEMAKSLNVSTSYASRTFSDQMGVTIKEYINEIRMYHAQHLLRYTDWPVSMVAERVGYPDVRSFYKMYEKHFGMPCSQLRRLLVGKPVQKQEATP